MIALNYQQNNAVKLELGPSIIMASAGSGKTYVLIRKILNLLENNAISSENILVLTFSKKACLELKNRIAEHGYLVENIFTFHAFGLKILEEHGQAFTLTDNAAIQGFVRLLDNSITSYNFQKYNELINLIENQGVSSNNLFAYDFYHDFRSSCLHLERNLSEVEIEACWKLSLKINKIKNQLNIISYNDLLLRPLNLLRSNSDIADSLAAQYKYIYIDEFQDINDAQYKLIKTIVSRQTEKNITAVGDNDQTIYQWRGASIETTDTFIKDFNPSIFYLEENYRSDSRITTFADQLIADNSLRKKKLLFSNKKVKNGGIFCLNFADENLMIAEILDIINNEIRNGDKYSNIAILTRINVLQQKIKKELKNARIPFGSELDNSFFKNAEIKFLVNMLKLHVNNRDLVSLSELLELVGGVGKETLQKIKNILDSDDKISIKNALKSIDNGQGKKNKKLLAIIEQIENIDFSSLSNFKAYYIENQDFDIINYNSRFNNIASEDTLHSINLFFELFQFKVQQFNRNLTTTEKSAILLDSILEIENKPQIFTEDKVSLITIHQAKGLEWNTVIIPYFSETIIPYRPSIEIKDSLKALYHAEEERRIAFVGITRGRNKVFLMHAEKVNLFNKKINLSFSSYIKREPLELGELNHE